jgi:hypothetical protein
MASRMKYQIPKAFDLSGLSARGGKPKPLSICKSGSSVSTPLCGYGNGPNSPDHGSCLPNGLSPHLGKCIEGDNATPLRCNSGSVYA